MQYKFGKFEYNNTKYTILFQYSINQNKELKHVLNQFVDNQKLKYDKKISNLIFQFKKVEINFQKLGFDEKVSNFI